MTNKHGQIVMGIFAAEAEDPKVCKFQILKRFHNAASQTGVIYLFYFFFQFITDPGVEQCGSLTLSLDPADVGPAAAAEADPAFPREIQARLVFGDTEVRAAAVDVATGGVVRCAVDFLSDSNPKYHTKL